MVGISFVGPRPHRLSRAREIERLYARTGGRKTRRRRPRVRDGMLGQASRYPITGVGPSIPSIAGDPAGKAIGTYLSPCGLIYP